MLYGIQNCLSRKMDGPVCVIIFGKLQYDKVQCEACLAFENPDIFGLTTDLYFVFSLHSKFTLFFS